LAQISEAAVSITEAAALCFMIEIAAILYQLGEITVYVTRFQPFRFCQEQSYDQPFNTEMWSKRWWMKEEPFNTERWSKR